MSDMKCPFCQQELDTSNYYTRCHNPHCNTTVEMEGTEELWQELIRTRKALDVAVDALNTLLKEKNEHTQPDLYVLTRALKEITALEQKESAFAHNKIEFPEYNDGLLEEFDKQFFENGQDDDLTETAPEQKDVK